MAYISFQPKDHFNTVLWTGTGSSNAITGVGFQPDWVWIKSRSEASNNQVWDSARGVQNYLISNTNAANDTDTAGVTAFGADGFTVGASDILNKPSSTFVAWNWKAGGTGVANTDGSVDSTVSVNTTAGFSIVTYTGVSGSQNVGHGLGTTPTMVTVKHLNGVDNWVTFDSGFPDAKDNWILYNSTLGTPGADSGRWGGIAPTSTTFNVSSSNYGQNNAVGGTYVAYCFTPVKGYSKFGKYTGNGNADGPFIYTGFRPAYILIKRDVGTFNWYLWDNKRLGYNVDNDAQNINLAIADDTGDKIDILSNGFKIKATDTYYNGSGVSVFYWAFAEFPIVSSNDIPGTAR